VLPGNVSNVTNVMFHMFHEIMSTVSIKVLYNVKSKGDDISESNMLKLSSKIESYN
jgi:hypothetical protein